jgi:diguanylate cyclase (GGDEF)-like protein
MAAINIQQNGIVELSASDNRAYSLRLELALNNMNQGLVMFDSSARIATCNDPYIEMYGLSRDVVKPSCSLKDLILHRQETGSFSGDVERYCIDILNRIARRQTTSTLVNTADGRTIEVVERPMADGGWVATHEDISMRRQTEAQITYMAHHDALTGLANRVLFREHLEQALKWVTRGEKLAVLYFDLDNFKDVNDTLGHQVGDDLLNAVAGRLRSCIREVDLAARLGGDEFAIVQAKLKEPDDAEQLATRLRDVIRAPYDLADSHIAIDSSIGIALAPFDGTNPFQLLKSADLALYEAKAEGGGRHRFFEPGMHARVTARRTLELDLRNALCRGEFELHYQPIIRLEGSEIVACEALLRWHHPGRGDISPAEFIPAAEETGLIVRLGEWVIRTACAEAMTWPNDIKVSVNVSPKQFGSCDLSKVIIGALDSTGLPANRLEIEITEALLMRDTGVTLATLHRLHQLGVRIAIDDFGTGYSSLGYLRNFPFDRIKIDQSFIRGLSDNGESVEIVRAVAGLASSLRMKTTAEGIETEEQQRIAKASGCTEMQGYLFSRPKAAKDLAKLFTNQPRKDEKALVGSTTIAI